MTKIIFCLLILYSTIIQASDNTEQKNETVEHLTFLSKQQKQNLYHQLIAFIEAYDAEGIETRKSTRDVKWKKYKKVKRENFIKAKNWNELRDSFNSFASGFINLHSRFKFNLEDEYPIIISKKINYSYPEIGFYLDETGEQVQEVNGLRIKKMFNRYYNYDCNFNSISGCLAVFVDDFNFGKILSKNTLPRSINLKNGINHKVNFKDFFGKRGAKEILQPNKEWKLLSTGHNIELYKRDKTILLRIKSFQYKSNEDIRCSTKVEHKSNICFDVRMIRTTLLKNSTNSKFLIIDLQNNGGGQENTSFVAELATKPFKDFPVLYPKTKILEDNEFRKTLFWGSTSAENWYQSLINTGLYDSTSYGDFLPVRGDFCRASKTCELKEIQENGYHDFKEIILLSNQFCISSCDDLIYRLHEFAGAKVIGIPSAADVTYSRISAVFYIDKLGKIQRKLYAESNKPDINGVEIFSMKIPYSKSLDFKNNLLIQGKPIMPEVLVAIDHKSLNMHSLQVLNKAYEYISNITEK